MAEEDQDPEQNSWDAMVKRRALWLQSFWFVRGVMGTMALVALIPQVTELDQIEVLRALYALIISWNDVMAWVGRQIAYLFAFPTIPNLVVSFVVYFSAIGVPSLLGALRANSLNFRLTWLGVTALSISYIQISLGHNFSTDNYEFKYNSLKALIIVVYIAGFCGIYYALKLVDGFRNGLLFTLGVIATITVGYNIGTTDFSDWVNATVCAELNIAASDCTEDGLQRWTDRQQPIPTARATQSP